MTANGAGRCFAAQAASKGTDFGKVPAGPVGNDHTHSIQNAGTGPQHPNLIVKHGLAKPADITAERLRLILEAGDCRDEIIRPNRERQAGSLQGV